MLELLRSLWNTRRRFDPPSSLCQDRFRPRLEPLEDRLLPTSGVLDPTFGDQGQVLSAFGYIQNVAQGVASYPSGPNRGKIVVVGNLVYGVQGPDSVVVARYNTDGSLDTDPDTGFGPLDGNQRTGWVLSHFGSNDRYENVLNAVALQPDDQGDFKIIVVGGAGVSEGSQIHTASVVARFLDDGTLDPTFGQQGVVYSAFHEPPPHDDTARNDVATAITIDPNTNNLIVASSSHTSGVYLSDINDYGLGIYSPNGQVLAAVRTSLGGVCGDDATGVALQPNGNIIVIGSTCTGGDQNGYEWGLASYLYDGGLRLDQSFGDHGIVRTHFAPQGVRSDDFPSGVVVQPDGGIVVAGTIHVIRAGGAIGLARYLPNGTLDSSFGNGGIVETAYDFDSGGHRVPANVDAVLLQPDGKIIVAGGEVDSPIVPSWSYFAAARFLPDGSFDSSKNDPTDPFGPTGSGSVTTPFINSHGESFAEAYAITFEEYDTDKGPVTKLVAAGVTVQDPLAPDGIQYVDFGLARYDLDSIGGGGGGPRISVPGITQGGRTSAAPVAVVGAPVQEAVPWTLAADAFLTRWHHRTTNAPRGEEDPSQDEMPALALGLD
jgi:uncharacterized delta-60 repeat protein